MDFVRSVYESWDESYAAELLRRFDLKPHQKTGRLSHGQRVKAMMLLALARRPRLLVFDEPTTGLDPVARHEVLEEMMAVLADESRTILFSSHNTLDVEQISDYITFIRDGRIVESRDKESFLDRWRRVRVELPESSEVPHMPETVEVRRTGRLAVLTTRGFGPELQGVLQGAGAAVLGVERMTLEEIFVAAVSRKGR